MRVSLQPAYLLHQRPYRESSALLEVLTPEHGRRGLVARGARRSSSRLRPVLQAFRPLLLSWTGKGELGSLTGAESAGGSLPLAGERLLSGLYLNELLMRLLHRNEPHPDLFDAYRQAIGELAGSAPAEPLLRVFEKRLLEGLGYGLMLDQEAESGADIEVRGEYVYIIEHGPVVHAGPASRQVGTRVSGATLQALASEVFSGTAELSQAKRLMRNILSHYLGERPLASRALFRGRGGTDPN